MLFETAFNNDNKLRLRVAPYLNKAFSPVGRKNKYFPIGFNRWVRLRCLMNLADLISCTSDLRLQAVSPGDASAFFHIVKENEKYFERFDFLAPKFETVDEIEAVICRLMQLRSESRGASFGLWQGSDLIGLMTINHIDWKKKEADVGYWLIEKASGHGYATTAFKALVDYCLNELDLKTLTAHTATTNLKSQKVLKKVGFKETMTLKERVEVRGRKVDDFLFKLKRKSS